MEPTPGTPQKHFLNRVTPFSKLFALILFVTLPILALYVGYQQGVKSTNYQGSQPSSNSSSTTNEASVSDSNSKSVFTLQGPDFNFSFEVPEGWVVSGSRDEKVPIDIKNSDSIFLIRENHSVTDSEFIVVGMSLKQAISFSEFPSQDFSTLYASPNQTTNEGSKTSRIIDDHQAVEVSSRNLGSGGGNKFAVGIWFKENNESYYIAGWGRETNYVEVRGVIEKIATTWKFN